MARSGTAEICKTLELLALACVIAPLAQKPVVTSGSLATILSLLYKTNQCPVEISGKALQILKPVLETADTVFDGNWSIVNS
jgi:hypothetical protein